MSFKNICKFLIIFAFFVSFNMNFNVFASEIENLSFFSPDILNKNNITKISEYFWFPMKNAEQKSRELIINNGKISRETHYDAESNVLKEIYNNYKGDHLFNVTESDWQGVTTIGTVYYKKSGKISNKMITKSYFKGKDNFKNDSELYIYNDKMKITSIVYNEINLKSGKNDENKTIVFQYFFYDDKGNLIEIQKYDSKKNNTSNEFFKYSKNNIVTEKQLLDPKGELIEKIEYEYDNKNLLTKSSTYNKSNKATKIKKYKYEFKTGAEKNNNNEKFVPKKMKK